MNTMIIILLLVILIPVFLSLMFIPYWTRKTESFGVSIPEAVFYSSELKAMRKHYVWMTGLLSFIIVAVFILSSLFLTHNENTVTILFTTVTMIFLLGSFLIYLKFHSKMKELKEKRKWSKEHTQQVFINTQFRNHKLIYSNAWFLLSFIITMLTIIVTFRFYKQIPEQIPMQYNFTGEVTNWAVKSYRTVLMMPIMQIYLTALFLFINMMIARAKQQVSAENPERSLQQNMIFRRRWSAYIIITGIGLTLLFTFIQLSFIFPVNQQLLTILPLVFGIGVMIGTIVLAITTGQGGSRIRAGTSKNGKIIDRDNDRYWKLGVIYFNKNDPSLFLEKRFGVGWTINLARPLAWSMLLIIILLATGIPILLSL